MVPALATSAWDWQLGDLIGTSLASVVIAEGSQPTWVNFYQVSFTAAGLAGFWNAPASLLFTSAVCIAQSNAIQMALSLALLLPIIVSPNPHKPHFIFPSGWITYPPTHRLWAPDCFGPGQSPVLHSMPHLHLPPIAHHWATTGTKHSRVRQDCDPSINTWAGWSPALRNP